MSKRTVKIVTNHQNCSVLCCVQPLCTMICARVSPVLNVHTSVNLKYTLTTKLKNVQQHSRINLHVDLCLFLYFIFLLLFWFEFYFFFCILASVFLFLCCFLLSYWLSFLSIFVMTYFMLTGTRNFNTICQSINQSCLQFRRHITRPTFGLPFMFMLCHDICWCLSLFVVLCLVSSVPR